MKTKYIIFIALIAVYIFVQTSDEKKTGVGGIALEELALLGYGGGASEAVSRRKSTEGGFTSTTNILFNGWTILAIVGVLIYLIGGFDAIFNNPMLLVFGILIIGVMAIMK